MSLIVTRSATSARTIAVVAAVVPELKTLLIRNERPSKELAVAFPVRTVRPLRGAQEMLETTKQSAVSLLQHPKPKNTKYKIKTLTTIRYRTNKHQMYRIHEYHR